MRRLVCESSGKGTDYKIEACENTELKQHEVILKVKSCAFCKKAEYLTNKVIDCTAVGLQGVGEVAHVGDSVDNVKNGSVVAFVLPLNTTSSGAGEYCVVPSYLLLPCPITLKHTDISASLLPLVTASRALKGQAVKGDTVVLTGPGTPEGQMILQMLALRGCKVIAVMLEESERALTKPVRHCIDFVVECWIPHLNVPEAISRETQGLGASLIISLKEVFSLSEAIQFLAVGGTYITPRPCSVSDAMSHQMLVKGCSLHYLSPHTPLLSPYRLGTFLNDLSNGLKLLEQKQLVPPFPITKVGLEDALTCLQGPQTMENVHLIEF